MNSVTNIDLETTIRLLGLCAERAGEIGVAMSFSVVDTAGHPVAVHRMDGAGWATLGLAQGKATAAAAMRMPSADLGTRWKDFPALTTAATVLNNGHFVPLPGGFPLKVEGVVVGAIGASGGTGAQDADACLTGIAKLGGLDPQQ